MPTIPQLIASAFGVLCGQYGDVTKMAKDREQSRQSLYREAEQVVNAVDGAAAQARSDEQQQQIVAQRTEIQALQERRKHAVEITPDKRHEFATVAQAEGVSLSVARRLFQVVEGAEPTPSVATLGRATLEAGQHAGGLLEVLDEAARPLVQQGTVDEIFSWRSPVGAPVPCSSDLANRFRQHALGQRTIPPPTIEFPVALRGFHRGQGQHPLSRPTHPLVLAAARDRPVVQLLHPRARDP